ncbi:hypothetical protein M433DRAFT_3875 [Acidomyces richmondensis BFW]|nr:MAG: hypothetical protein FE78DRAFT_40099 [Acidomyces sp. 'richmondensis']KYG46271.1 hypothetical protein M433DRAFT_3875 [Acidomyces richmondensis BFW]
MPIKQQTSRRAAKSLAQPGNEAHSTDESNTVGHQEQKASTEEAIANLPSTTREMWNEQSSQQSPATSAHSTATGNRVGSLAQSAVGSQPSAPKPIMKPKFAGRRSQAARAEAEKAEAERQRAEAQARAKEEASKARALARLRGRGSGRSRGRGRGGYMGERERIGEQIASGPFSSGQVNSQAMSRTMWAPGGRGGRGGSGSSQIFNSIHGTGTTTIKPDPGIDENRDVSVMSRPIKQEDGGYISSDDDGNADENMRRVNIDDMKVVDLTGDADEEDRIDLLSAFQPVRLQREAHKDRHLGVKTDVASAEQGTASNELENSANGAVSEKRKGKQKVKEVEITGETERYHGTYSSSDEQDPIIKSEPVEDEMVVDELAPINSAPMIPQEAPSSPESRRKTKERIKPRTLSSNTMERPAFQTQEEFDEDARHQVDLRILHSELGSIALSKSRTDSDGDAVVSGAENGNNEQVRDKKEDKVYLFQFPPVLPDLHPIKVKPDPDAAISASTNAGTDLDVMELDKNEPDSATDQVKTASHLKLPSGALGKLRVHKSGKCTLDWGGMSFSVGMGTEASFLQDILVIDLPERKPDASGNGNETVDEHKNLGGTAMSMGQVKGKFVVTPDWEKMLS